MKKKCDTILTQSLLNYMENSKLEHNLEDTNYERKI